jgi:hypothetical protein
MKFDFMVHLLDLVAVEELGIQLSCYLFSPGGQRVWKQRRQQDKFKITNQLRENENKNQDNQTRPKQDKMKFDFMIHLLAQVADEELEVQLSYYYYSPGGRECGSKDDNKTNSR